MSPKKIQGLNFLTSCLYYKKIGRMTIVSDASSCGVTYNRYSVDSKNGNYYCSIFMIQATEAEGGGGNIVKKHLATILGSFFV